MTLHAKKRWIKNEMQELQDILRNVDELYDRGAYQQALLLTSLEGAVSEQVLREAQLEMKAKYPDPLYWDAFIYQGASGILSISPAAAIEQS